MVSKDQIEEEEEEAEAGAEQSAQSTADIGSTASPTVILEEEDDEESSSGKGKTKKAKKAKKVKVAGAGAKKPGPKGKGTEKSSIRSATSRDMVREMGRCSFCGNLLSQTKKINYHEVKGLKGDLSKNVTVALCDDCEWNQAEGKLVDLKTAMVKNENGTITNVNIAELIGGTQRQ